MNLPASTGPRSSDPDAPVESPAAATTDAPQTTSWHLVRTLEVLSRRRRFLLDRREQLRAVYMVGGGSAVLLALLNVALYVSRARSAAAVLHDAPALRELILSQTRMETLALAGASLVFVAGVILITILETHRTAGAAFNLARHMAAVQSGHYDIALQLRKGDNLRELEVAFNDMAHALREQTVADVAELDALAAGAESICGPDEAQDLAERIRARARDTRRRID